MRDGAADRSTILVVGAGPVGLMTAILLARHGLRSIVIDRYGTRHGAPKAHALNPRSLEICRSIGLDMEAMKRRATPADDGGWVRFVTTLAGEEIGVMPYERQDERVLDVTPTPLINLAQPSFEDVLLEEIARSPLIEVRRGLRWIGCEQSAGAVTSTIEDVATGERTALTTRYVIGADGASSAVRRELGIAMVGDDTTQAFITIHFGANLRDVVADRPAILYWIMQPPHAGVLIAYDIDRNWCMLYPHDPAVTPREHFTPPVCEEILRHAIGGGDHAIEIKHILPWMLMSQVADRYRVGNVFLVGDAAHRFPPTGGLGLNTGLQDAHNLAWKMAAVVAGSASDRLLDSYHDERHSVAVTNSQQSYSNAHRMLTPPRAVGAGDGIDAGALARRLADPAAQKDVAQQIANQRQHFDSLALQLGFVYGVPGNDETSNDETADVSDFRPELVVGGRMPHAWLEHGGAVIPLLDLLDPGRFPRLAGERAGPGPSSGPSVKIVVEGKDFTDPRGELRRFVNLAAGEAVLVRPDGHVAAIIPRGDGDALRATVSSTVASALFMERAA